LFEIHSFYLCPSTIETCFFLDSKPEITERLLKGLKVTAFVAFYTWHGLLGPYWFEASKTITVNAAYYRDVIKNFYDYLSKTLSEGQLRMACGSCKIGLQLILPMTLLLIWNSFSILASLPLALIMNGPIHGFLAMGSCKAYHACWQAHNSRYQAECAPIYPSCIDSDYEKSWAKIWSSDKSVSQLSRGTHRKRKFQTICFKYFFGGKLMGS